MSTTTWALREIESRPGMSRDHRITLLALTTLVDSDYRRDGATAEEIARVTGDSVRWVAAHLRWLATTGIHQDHQSRPPVYRLPVEAVPEPERTGERMTTTLPDYQRRPLEKAIWGKLPSVLREKHGVDDERLAHTILDALLENLAEQGLEVAPKDAGVCSVCGKPVHRLWHAGPVVDGEWAPPRYDPAVHTTTHAHDRPWQVR